MNKLKNVFKIISFTDLENFYIEKIYKKDGSLRVKINKEIKAIIGSFSVQEQNRTNGSTDCCI